MKLIQWFSNFEIVDRRKTKMLTYNDFYYCYDVKQMVFLRYKMGIPYICVGLHEKTKGKFFQFHKTWIYVKMLDTQKLSFWFCATTFIGGSTSRVAYQSEKGF